MENEDVCGLTTGSGKENCEWDCISSLGSFYQNPECLIDCFEADHCAVKAIKDYQEAKGICKGTTLAETDGINNVLPTSIIDCVYDTFDFLDENGTFLFNITYPDSGIFSEDTLQALRNNETCIFDVFQKSPVVYNTIELLVYTSSNLRVYQDWYYFSGKLISGFPTDILSILLPCTRTHTCNTGRIRPLSLNTRLHPGFR